MTIEHLKNNGDIIFTNTYSITVGPGSIDVGYDIGTLTIQSREGSLLGFGQGDVSNPGIIVWAVDFTIPGTVGIANRRLVLKTRDSLQGNDVITGTVFSPFFSLPKPPSIHIL